MNEESGVRRMQEQKMGKHILSRLLLAVISLTLIFLGVIGSACAGTETLISTNTTGSNEINPSISGNWIVWTDHRNDHGSGTSDIYAYNVVTGEERRVTKTGSIADHPSISSDSIVWDDFRNLASYQIYAYDLGTGIERKVTNEPGNKKLPSVSGTRVVWQDDRDGDSDIYMMDLSGGDEELLTPNTPGSDQVSPAISGTLVVWQDARNGGSDIYMNDTATSQLFNLNPSTAGPDHSSPAISGSRVVWQDSRGGSNDDIYLNDTSTWSETRVNDPVPGSEKLSPSISASRVVWVEDRTSSHSDIYLKDLSGGSDIRITGNSAMITTSDGGPKISGDRIVWTDQRNGNNDIYMYTIGPDQTCPVADFTIAPSQSGKIPFTVRFTDTSSAGTTAISHYRWEFGDGNTSTEQNPQFTYNVAGNFNVRLTINNAYCRNETPVSNNYKISVGAAPVAGFTPNVTSGMVPLPVKFIDSSVGATAWNWSFGDGTYSAIQSPTHSYSAGGTYTALLNASNSYGYSVKQATIQALTGADENADLAIDGIAITTPYSGQFLTYDTAKLPDPVNTGMVLVTKSPQLSAHGLQNITFLCSDGIGFRNSGGIIRGNISGVTIQTKDIRPSGFSKSVGDSVFINYSISLSSYPVGGTLNTRVWEGSTSSDYSAFDTIARSAGYSEIWGIAYTTKITRTNIAEEGTARLLVTVNSSWVSGLNGRSHTFAERIADNRSIGEVLPAQFLSADPGTNYDTFLIDSKRGSSTFGLAQLSGSGNPFQLITLTILGQLDPGSYLTGSSDSGPQSSGKNNVQNAPAVPVQEMKAPVAPDPGKSEKVFTNPAGLTTQPMTLVSTDKLLSVALDKGVIAHDKTGSPLTSITLAAVPAENVAASTGSAVYSFAGMAYEFQPDGATFSPAISLSFTIPQAAWGQNYVIQRYDRATGLWEEMPSSFDSQTGVLSGSTDHFCTFAVFAKSIPGTKTPAPQMQQTPPPLRAPPSEPHKTAVSIFMDMIGWVSEILMRNGILVIVIAAVAGFSYYWFRIR